MNKRLRDWASKLSQEQMIKLLAELVENGIISKYISFRDGDLVPYCSYSREPMVEGQVVAREL